MYVSITTAADALVPVEIDAAEAIESFNYVKNKFAICGNPAFNEVHARHDGFGVDLPPNRVWSMQSDALADFVGVSGTHTKPHCSTVAQVLEAGGSLVIEQKCRIQWMSAHDMCKVFNKYRYVEFSGDSLIRHMTMANRMLLHENFRYGGNMVPQFPESAYSKCGCDGQFSEMVECRKGEFNTHFSPGEGMCGDVENFQAQFMFELRYGGGPPSMQNICQPEYPDKAVFILLGQGVHIGFNPDHFIQNYLVPVIDDIEHQIEVCSIDLRRLIKVVVIGGAASSTLVVGQYPKQHHDTVIAYNEGIRDFMATNYHGVEIFSPFNLSIEAIETRSSDGHHVLADVNSMKAMVMCIVLGLVFLISVCASVRARLHSIVCCISHAIYCHRSS